MVSGQTSPGSLSEWREGHRALRQGNMPRGTSALAPDHTHSIPLARARQGMGKRLHLLMGGAEKNTDAGKGEKLGPFLQSAWKRSVSNSILDLRALEGQGSLGHCLRSHSQWGCGLQHVVPKAVRRERGSWEVTLLVTPSLSFRVWNSGLSALGKTSKVAQSLSRPLIHQEL